MLAGIITLFSVGAAFGWFYDYKKHEDNTQLKPFALSLRVWFYQGEGKQDVEVDNSGQFLVNLTQESDPSYIGKLRISVTFSGNESAALKLYVMHFWEQNGAQPSRANALFLTGTDFLTNKADSCYYFCRNATQSGNPRENYFLTSADSGNTLPVITGYDNTIIYEDDITLKLYIRAEGVQANRAEAIWGSLPGVA